MAIHRVRFYGAAAGAALLVLACAGRGRGAAAAPEPEDLRRGLITTFQDQARPAPSEVVRLEPTIALALKDGEAAHPRLLGDGGTVVWKGYLNVLRSGNYRFQANLRGKFRLTVGGKEVLAGDVQDELPALKEGAEVRLESGVAPLVAEYTRPAGAARVEVFWKGPGFRLEPLPYDALGYLPKEAPPALGAQAKVEQGRFLAEEHSCAKCHLPAAADAMAKTLTARQGPDLSKAGGRVHPGWIEAWLESPAKMRPGTAMPALFADDDNGRAERHAVTHYLASLGGPVAANPKPPSEKDVKASETRGQKLFMTIGCVACHGLEKTEKGENKKESGPAFIAAAPAHFPLTGLGGKTTPEKLAEYLQDPTGTDPASRMPHMLLQGPEALDLARYLCQPGKDDVKPDLSDAPGKDKLSDAQVDDLGKRLVVAKGCVNCHTIAPGGQPLAPALKVPALEDLAKISAAGCIAPLSDKHLRAPAFDFSEADCEALRAFLTEGLKGAGTPAPAYTARETTRQMNCIACHAKDGEGGLTTDVVDQLRKFENAENAEAVAPPTLTGVGHKLRTAWLKQVLLSAARARPWMSLRMPQFGEPNVGRLPEALAAMEGAAPDDDVHKTPLTAAKIEAGRTLIGKSAFGCISCHDLAGIPNTGTRGPDLAGMNQRVRYEWYLRWLEQPQRMQPGTRMPQVFTDGKSLLATVLNGAAAAQADALWGYLSLGPGLPLPEGLETTPKGIVLKVKDRPYLLRTFMPDAGSRAVAVGFPSGVSAAFDAHTCRLAYAWSGQFLDASPVWDGRGGNPAHVLGPHIWNAPAGCPVAATTSNEPPDFAARAKDPAFGGGLPEGKLFDGVPLLHFDGYSEDKDGVPTFRYHLQAGTDDRLDVSERITALRNGAAAGVARHFALQAPAHQNAWLLAGDCAGEPKLLDAKGEALPLDLKAGAAETPAAAKAVVLPQSGDHVIVLTLSAAPDAAVWRVQKGGAGWQVLLRIPSQAPDGKIQADLDVWVPYRNEPELIKGTAFGAVAPSGRAGGKAYDERPGPEMRRMWRAGGRGVRDVRPRLLRPPSRGRGRRGRAGRLLELPLDRQRPRRAVLGRPGRRRPYGARRLLFLMVVSRPVWNPKRDRHEPNPPAGRIFSDGRRRPGRRAGLRQEGHPRRYHRRQPQGRRPADARRRLALYRPLRQCRHRRRRPARKGNRPDQDLHRQGRSDRRLGQVQEFSARFHRRSQAASSSPTTASSISTTRSRWTSRRRCRSRWAATTRSRSGSTARNSFPTTRCGQPPRTRTMRRSSSSRARTSCSSRSATSPAAGKSTSRRNCRRPFRPRSWTNWRRISPRPPHPPARPPTAPRPPTTASSRCPCPRTASSKSAAWRCGPTASCWPARAAARSG